MFNNESFKRSLRKAVEEIESHSGVEIVVAISPRLRKYHEVSWALGCLTMFSGFSFVMFSDHVLTDEYFYIFTLISFFPGFLMGRFMAFTEKLYCKYFVNNEKLSKVANIHAHATFQRGRMYETKEKIGVLFYFSKLESLAVVLPDIGALERVPQSDWEKINLDCQSIFKHPNPADKLIESMKTWIPIFEQYIVLREDDINELPDSLEVL